MPQAKKDDAGEAQVADTFAKANEKGYFGRVPDQPANREYTLQTGPESPKSERVLVDERDLKE